MPRESTTLPEYWDTYKPYREEGEQPAPDVETFAWTQYDGHGPGEEFLGSPRTALELGCAEGKEAVYLARTGVAVTALDFSAAQVARARRWWDGAPGLTFVQAEACDYLATTETTYDAVFSIWGALWFTDPDDLIPLIAKRLSPGGTLAFSQAEPLEGYYGPQPMYGNGLAGRKLTLLRWSYPPQWWADLLKRTGFVDIDARVLPAPRPTDVGTLMVRASAPK
ncbi:class I SAM-dependent methyltransferase [Streptomyces sp. DASNCL29]|uniref:class I SAM-dependent methyltransferase n=1 Tax=Streptomyces sp. DASNCL29 TaxID=2583819 RepID=UPI00110FD09F|nr:class I SAM-dependent methyltransferase [Streptomyces sp. DASNCL29]TMU94743.1 class I SAM-dependent methyltransferase [Streptomyces sp. DASNCL29]